MFTIITGVVLRRHNAQKITLKTVVRSLLFMSSYMLVPLENRLGLERHIAHRTGYQDWRMAQGDLQEYNSSSARWVWISVGLDLALSSKPAPAEAPMRTGNNNLSPMETHFEPLCNSPLELHNNQQNNFEKERCQ